MTNPAMDELVNGMLDTYYRKIKGLREEEAKNRKEHLSKILNECITETSRICLKEEDSIYHHVLKTNKTRMVKKPKKIKTFLGNKLVKYDTIW